MRVLQPPANHATQVSTLPQVPVLAQLAQPVHTTPHKATQPALTAAPVITARAAQTTRLALPVRPQP